MNSLPNYINKHGIEFQIQYERAPVPEDADYFAFRILTKMGDGRGRNFYAYVKKSLYNNIDMAEHFATKSDPIDELKRQLDFVDKSGTSPLFWPDSFRGWTVM